MSDLASGAPVKLDPGAGDLFDRLSAFFETETGEPVEILDLTAITGGYSRAMNRFGVASGGVVRRYVLRADPPPGTSILDTDRAQEWALLQALHRSSPVPIPKPCWFDPTGERLGSPALIVEEIAGQTLMSMVREAEASVREHLARNVCATIVAVHSCPTDSLETVLGKPGSWNEYIDEQIQRWVDVERAQPNSIPFMRWVARWLDAHRPPALPLGLVHGDFQPPNVLVEQDGRMVLVDWELAHIGDPREDLGWWALACASQPPDIFAENIDAVCALYRDMTGAAEEAVNPYTIAYFTVLSSIGVYSSLLAQCLLMARGRTDAMQIAYMTVAEPFMHGVWMDAIDKVESGSEARS